jgi:hypothetical protein
VGSEVIPLFLVHLALVFREGKNIKFKHISPSTRVSVLRPSGDPDHGKYLWLGTGTSTYSLFTAGLEEHRGHETAIRQKSNG